MDKDSNSCPLSWSANKIQRVVRSILAAEVMIMQDAVENTLFKVMLNDIFGNDKCKMPIEPVTDNVFTV